MNQYVHPEIMSDSEPSQTIPFKRLYSNTYLFNHREGSSLSRKYDSTSSTPTSLKHKTSFEDFISEEKNNLKLFPSFRQAQLKCCTIDHIKKFTNSFYLLPNTQSNSDRSTSNNSQLYESPDEIVELDFNTPSTTDFILASRLNDIEQQETDNTIDISIQLLGHSDMSSKPICDENNNLFRWYDRTIIDTLNKTSNSIRSKNTESDREPPMYNIMHYLSRQIAKSRNQHKSSPNLHGSSREILEKKITKQEDKASGCCCFKNSKKKMNDSAMDRIKVSTISATHEQLNVDSVSEISNVMTSNIQIPMKLIEDIGMNDKAMNNIEINTDGQSVMFQSTLKNHSREKSKSSIDIQNLFTDSNEDKSMTPYKLNNGKNNLLEVTKLPPSINRPSRMLIYQKVYERLSIVNLIDMDITALLRVILQSFQ